MERAPKRNLFPFIPVSPLHSNSTRVATIPNGWIALRTSPDTNNPNGTTPHFTANCDEDYSVNSNSSQVTPLKLGAHNKWLPVGGYLVQGLGLCSRHCTFQSSLSNGFIQVEASASKATLKDGELVGAYEGSLVKFRCFEGYKMRSIGYNRVENSTG